MARPVEFDKAEALEAGMKVFWAHGYAAASMDRLVRSMGLSRSSFYQTFGSKRDLLLAAIDHYIDRQLAELDQMWVGRGVVDSIRLLFQSVVEDNCGGWGCLLVNSAAEIAPHDQGIEERVRRGFERTIATFEGRIVQAQTNGEIPANRSAHDLATILASSLAGLRILAKAGMPRLALEAVRDDILSGFMGSGSR